MFTRAGQTTSLCGDAVRGKGVWEGTAPLAGLSAGFQSLSLTPTSKLGPSGADSQVGGFLYVLGPCGSLQGTLLWGWAFSPAASTPTGFFSQRLWGSISLHWNPGSRDLSHSPVVTPGLPAHKCGTALSTSRSLTVSPLQPGCPFPPLLPVWINISSWTPWLSDFHTVQFSGNSEGGLFLNLLLFFWLCEEDYASILPGSLSLWFWFAFSWWLMMLSSFSCVYHYQQLVYFLERKIFRSFVHFLLGHYLFIIEL